DPKIHYPKFNQLLVQNTESLPTLISPGPKGAFCLSRHEFIYRFSALHLHAALFSPLMTDAYRTLAAPSTGEYKDRGSKFLAYAWPVRSETEALAHLENLRKEHFKARHHCFAWRLGADGSRFRANDDGEPGGTAGRPILGQIDSFGLTEVVVVVVRYFGGTLLGTSGLIQAYREAAAEALRAGQVVEKIVSDIYRFDFDYALMPDVMQALKRLDASIVQEAFGERGRLSVAIRQSEVATTLLQAKALIRKVSAEEAAGLPWPAGLTVEAEDGAD
ncbi:MAG TPA: YigZ family protein, partial [Saprospiraceae bacterium]|nr:YigZ family protein [Saprospiraceae bacterium]